jgi:predicted AAA+ superfamily ATPase
MPSSLYPRLLRPRVDAALRDTPVVLLNGPRQAGKTTLVQQFAGARRRYLTLDDPATLLSAHEDPVGLVRGLDRVVIDEVQRAPSLLLAIKRAVDQDRRPGRFLLTGSANLLLVPDVADSLAGRMETLALLPLAGCEIHRGKGRWLDAVFAGRPPRVTAAVGRRDAGGDVVRQVLSGGYPEAVARADTRRRATWARQYVDALVQRDVREIASVEKLDHLPRLLRAMAQMSGQLCNFAELAGQVGLDSKTASKYVALFERVFLVRRLAPWSANRLNRIVKTPKLQFLDSGLLCGVTGLDELAITRDRTRFGPALESYVFGELLKLASWSAGDYEVFTYRDKDQVEVDFVVEDRAGAVAGVEVKAAASVSRDDFGGLRRLAALAKDQFSAGVLLYDGTETVPVGDRLWAMPLSALWLS